MATLMPIKDKILVKPDEEERTTASGIVIPNSVAEKKSETGIVVAIGKDEEIEVKKGERVLFKAYTPDEIEFDGEKLLIMTQEDILAIIE